MLLTGCTQSTSDDLDRIGRPANHELLLEGTWKITARFGNDTVAGDQVNSADSIIGEKMGFSRLTIVFGRNYWNNVSYKVKRVGMTEYLFHKKIDGMEKLGLNDNEALVYTAYSQDKFLYEFVRISEDKLLVNINEQYYSMERISDKFSGIGDAMAGTMNMPEAGESQAKNQSASSGILLGIRTPVKTDDGIGDYSYKTYWISSVNRSFRPVLSAADIYLPRMDGFWKLKTEKRMGDEGTEDILTASIISKRGENPPAAVMENTSRRVETKLRSAVVYVGNDYVCVENTALAAGQNTTSAAFTKTLRTLPVDNLINIDGIKISDLAGENGRIALDSAVSDLLKGAGYNGIVNVDETSLQESFALYRKMGHWFFKGRLNLNPTGQLPYMDFNLNLIPPANMVAYDMLQVPWTEIKDKLPQAVDVYTSPNKDIAIVLMRNSIQLFTINNKTLSSQPSLKLPLAEGSSVIMAEWSVGDYVQSWERSFVKNNKTVLEAGIK